MKRLTVLFAALALAGPVVRAADAPPPSAAAPADPLASARSLIAERKWAAASDELKRVNAVGSADWNNLMGYTHRKAKTPDYAAAEHYYDTALKINPQHRGALEYSGELYLMTGQLPKAEQRLAMLDKVCATPCEEQADLRAAVVAYKANGNRYVAH